MISFSIPFDFYGFFCFFVCFEGYAVLLLRVKRDKEKKERERGGERKRERGRLKAREKEIEKIEEVPENNVINTPSLFVPRSSFHLIGLYNTRFKLKMTI